MKINSIFQFPLFLNLQMHNPIQMKPADSENRNGKFFLFFL